MRVIYKYTLSLIDRQNIEMPTGYEILSIGVQGSNLVLWAMVDPEMKETKVPIEINGTGNGFVEFEGEEKKYIGTVQLEFFVWHVFEINT